MIETVQALLDAARQHGLELTADRDEFDKSGLDFLVVHAKDASGTCWVVRTPRRPELLETARLEGRALQLLAPKLPVAIPEWRIHADDVIAYPRLPGTPAVTLDASGAPQWHLDPSAPSELFLDSFAGALAALQSIDEAGARAAGIPTKPIDEARLALARSMDETRAALAPSDAIWARWHAWLENDGLWPDYLTLVHGDLHPGHMLLDAEGRLSGILDWTEACVTDPCIDFAMFFGCFGRRPLERLVERFAMWGGRTWPRLVDHAAERWASFPALVAEWALRTDNEAILEHARAHLASVTENMTQSQTNLARELQSDVDPTTMQSD
ncbi:macrolide 2'-phosphotransferase [Pendulispora rubella]|uniref:Macrolide 2'-phosphotransferase n=1 Tax=Pendulispora rubella TaxID=2741070 RepID=A0ABZ2LFA5_9BACT